ncbi:hypothetical protein [Paenibacillus massiliensis]|uniref:hypothetical protein n=1 Tax=Paenibacillus massiliensis TaxID=225917 RepID=UPI00036B9EDB|nr:hypothetical protein [Paenibacillus massiliensis]
MLNLVSEPIGFIISTTDVEVVYTEHGGATIRLDAQKSDIQPANALSTDIRPIEPMEYEELEIYFPIVAEVNCISLNFYEAHHGEFEILDGQGMNGFYAVPDSQHLQQRQPLYDPRNRLNLRHYLITGNDSYIELIASDYSIRKTQKEK